MQYSYL